MKKLGIFALGFAAALVVALACGWVYLKWGHPPVAVSDAAFPLEAKIVRVQVLVKRRQQCHVALQRFRGYLLEIQRNPAIAWVRR